MISFYKWSTLISAHLLLCGCEKPPPPPPISIPQAVKSEPWFVNEASERGVDFVWCSGANGKHHMPEIIGGGVAMIDVDGDDDLDLYFVQGGSMFAIGDAQNANQLFINKDGHFYNQTTSSGAGDTGYGMSVATGDIDNDGDLDLYITNFGKDALLRNEGSGKFTDITKKAGFTEEAWTTAAAFFDFDRDGDLDLFATRYLEWNETDEKNCGILFFNQHDYCPPSIYRSPLSDLLYENNGDGTFTDISEDAGISTATGHGLGIGIDDFDEDGLDDIFVANDMTEHHLWINRGGGRFVNEAQLRGCAIDSSGNRKAGMGTEVFDVDFDGDPDILVVNMENQSDSLFNNQGDGYFEDATGSTGLVGLSRLFTRFGVVHEDFNNDGNNDLYFANGRISRSLKPIVDDVYAEQNLLFSGNDQGIMTQMLPRGGTVGSPFHTSRAAATGDFDGDGALDIVVVNRDAPAYLLRNVTNANNFVELDIKNKHGSVAIGAIVQFNLGERKHRRRVRSARSYFASMSPIIHVGLGDNTQITDIV
ncbi:MAG: CRTAC1 family protein, partial [Phycisphaerales bacterium]|nr:CRTAC1 family protein [Phycisphaerales bacterium]